MKIMIDIYESHKEFISIDTHTHTNTKVDFTKVDVVDKFSFLFFINQQQQQQEKKCNFNDGPSFFSGS